VELSGRLPDYRRIFKREIFMQGVIMGYRSEAQAGIIKARTGQWYSFRKSEWFGGEPRPGMTVLFERGEQTLLFTYAANIRPANALQLAA
jgi:hypothetical protein